MFERYVDFFLEDGRYAVKDNVTGITLTFPKKNETLDVPYQAILFETIDELMDWVHHGSSRQILAVEVVYDHHFLKVYYRDLR